MDRKTIGECLDSIVQHIAEANERNHNRKGMPNTLVPTLRNEPWFRTLSFGEGGAYFWKEMGKADSAGAYCGACTETITGFENGKT